MGVDLGDWFYSKDQNERGHHRAVSFIINAHSFPMSDKLSVIRSRICPIPTVAVTTFSH